jgi:LuxR family transcriptional regulator, maltose regulon positive regulatory protein
MAKDVDSAVVAHQQPAGLRTSAERPTRLPLLPRKHLPRRRLCDSLEAATEGAVTILVAPAGAGKTLGVAGWLHTGIHPDAVWVAASPDLSIDVARRLIAQTGPELRPRLLVIDDAHTLSGGVLAYLDQRLSDDPQSLRLLLISRWDLPLTRLVPELLGDLTTLRGDLLRLDDDEVAALVAEHARTDSAEVCAAISSRAHGWCAAVVLAARAIAGARDPLAAARRLMSGSAVVDKVTSEVFATLTARQRHLLLCLADEDVVSSVTARHLSNDEHAGALLEDLESTGLLVSRYVDARHSLGDDDAAEATVKYRLHPLLVEVARRRLAAGGVDVERARSTVRRAVAIDVERGEMRAALRRLIDVGALDAAVQLLVDHGLSLVLAGQAEALPSFVRNHADLVEAERSCSLPVALDRWLSGDLRGSRHWLHRFELQSRGEHAGNDSWAVWDLEVASARLMRARLGDEPLAGAVADAEASVERVGAGSTPGSPLLALLMLHLGAAQLQLGRLVDADRNLTEAMRFGRSDGLSALSAEAASGLALSKYLQGREHACAELATESLSEDVYKPYVRATHAGVLLARKLALLQSVADARENVPAPRGNEPKEPAPGHDPVAIALAALLTARKLLLRGLVAEATRALDIGSVLHPLPRAVHLPLLLEQALQAALTSDSEELSRLERALRELGAAGEASYVSGLRVEGLGDTRSAEELFAAAAGESTCVQPPVAAMARSARAQLLHGEGRQAEAVEELRAALTATDVRRTTLPFLGWSRHGSPMTAVLRAVSDVYPTEWCLEILRILDGHPGITSVAGALTATPRERAHVPDGVVRPTLSPRERDVLHELARGATYADIASNLFVSENTVKTHVSSLYAKLAVSRRSDALAVARTLTLL